MWTLIGVASTRRRKAGALRPSSAQGGVRLSDRARGSDPPVPALGFDGAAALDAQGRLAGLAALKVPARSPAPRPRLERDRHAADAGRTPIRALLAAQGIAPAGAALAAPKPSSGSVVRVICVRK